VLTTSGKILRPTEGQSKQKRGKGGEFVPVNGGVVGGEKRGFGKSPKRVFSQRGGRGEMNLRNTLGAGVTKLELSLGCG